MLGSNETQHYYVCYDLCEWVLKLQMFYDNKTRMNRERESAQKPADLMTYEQLLSPFVLLFNAKQKLILLSHGKV